MESGGGRSRLRFQSEKFVHEPLLLLELITDVFWRPEVKTRHGRVTAGHSVALHPLSCETHWGAGPQSYPKTSQDDFPQPS